MKESTNLICIAEIIGPHGIRGDVRLKIFTNDPEGLKTYSPLLDEEKSSYFHIETLKITPKAVIVHFKGLNDRTMAESLRGTRLYIQQDRLPEPEINNYYYNDLLDIDVINKKGDILGKIVAVHNFGAGDIIEFLSIDRKSICIPFHHDYILDVDIKNKKITVGDIEGFY